LVTDAQNKDSFAERDQLHLVGYDSRRKRRAVICAARGNYYRPLITPDGKGLFLATGNSKIYVVDWQDRRPVCSKEPGCASEVWRDPHRKNVGLLSGKS
jgi:hypothetical protein